MFFSTCFYCNIFIYMLWTQTILCYIYHFIRAFVFYSKPNSVEGFSSSWLWASFSCFFACYLFLYSIYSMNMWPFVFLLHLYICLLWLLSHFLVVTHVFEKISSQLMIVLMFGSNSIRLSTSARVLWVGRECIQGAGHFQVYTTSSFQASMPELEA